MLRIDLIETGRATIFHLEGQLVGEWVEELRLAWVQARPSDPRSAEFVDLNLVTRVDAVGLHLLQVMQLAGVSFIATAPYTVSLLEDLDGVVLHELPKDLLAREGRHIRYRIEGGRAIRPVDASIVRA